MAKIFLSYSVRDGFDLAQKIERRLVNKGHRISIPVEFKVAGNWRNKLTKGLITADALIGAFGDSYASRRRRRYRSNTRSNVPLYLAQRSANISLLLASYHQAPERLRRT